MAHFSAKVPAPTADNNQHFDRIMNVSAISSLGKRSEDFTALQSTLQAGNIPGAQAAFAAFLQDVQKTSTIGGGSGLFAAGTQASKDLQTLGAALHSANLPGAQQALASLEQDIHSSGPAATGVIPHAHHHPTASEVANKGVAVLENAVPGSATAQSINSILGSKL